MELVDHLAEHGFEGAAGPAAGLRVQHHQQAVAGVVQVPQGKLALVLDLQRMCPSLCMCAQGRLALVLDLRLV